MLARREQILSRIEALLDAVEGVETVARNRGLLDNDARPALVLMDGDEALKVSGGGRGRGKMSASILTMRPQVFVVLKLRKPQNALVGQDLNAFRTDVVRALADDATLVTLVGTSGDIVYEGCETDLKSGMQVEGQMRLDFAITTVMDPYAN